MKKLPVSVKVYKKSPVFDERTVPAALLQEHSTKAEVWGKINVIEGKLLYVIIDNSMKEVELSSDLYGVVEPEVVHFVKPLGPVKFFVEFLK